jgi:hypothetical protein
MNQKQREWNRSNASCASASFSGVTGPPPTFDVSFIPDPKTNAETLKANREHRLQDYGTTSEKAEIVKAENRKQKTKKCLRYLRYLLFKLSRFSPFLRSAFASSISAFPENKLPPLVVWRQFTKTNVRRTDYC